MTKRTPRTLALVALALSSCVNTLPAPAEVEVLEEEEAGDTPRGIYFVVPKADQASDVEASILAAAAGPARRTLFVNFGGGTYRPGLDDASQNRSSIPAFVGTVPAYEKGAAAKAEVLQCLREQFARFDVEVTDQDPGPVPHVEAVMGGTPGTIGMPQGVGGVAPMTGDCSIIERAVVYTFTRVLPNARVDCEVAAQEVAHAYGLDHEYLCSDPMTYLNGCGAKMFQDVNAACGEYSPRQCMCGGARQNSVQLMLAKLGPAQDDGAPDEPVLPPVDDGEPQPQDGAAPTVEVIAPADQATLPPNASVSVKARVSDDVGVAKAELLWQFNGTHAMDCDAPPAGVTCQKSGDERTWTLRVGSGARSFSVRAIDAAGNTTTSPTRSLTFAEAQQEQPPPSDGPSVDVTSPSNGEVIARGQSVAVRAEAAGDVAQVWAWWILEGGSYRAYRLSPLGGSSWGLDLVLSAQAAPGSRTIRVAAFDRQGRRTVAPDVTITVPQ